MSVALVQGASRGLGLEFVRQLAARGGVTVVATCRRPEQANGDIFYLHKKHGKTMKKF